MAAVASVDRRATVVALAAPAPEEALPEPAAMEAAAAGLDPAEQPEARVPVEPEVARDP
jgi:hypothetical protein